MIYDNSLPLTTIKISTKTRDMLLAQRLDNNEDIEQVINRLLQNQIADDYLDEETLQDIQEGMEDIKAGRTYTTEQVKAELGLK